MYFKSQARLNLSGKTSQVSFVSFLNKGEFNFPFTKTDMYVKWNNIKALMLEAQRIICQGNKYLRRQLCVRFRRLSLRKNLNP